MTGVGWRDAGLGHAPKCRHAARSRKGAAQRNLVLVTAQRSAAQRLVTALRQDGSALRAESLRWTPDTLPLRCRVPGTCGRAALWVPGTCRSAALWVPGTCGGAALWVPGTCRGAAPWGSGDVPRGGTLGFRGRAAGRHLGVPGTRRGAALWVPGTGGGVALCQPLKASAAPPARCGGSRPWSAPGWRAGGSAGCSRAGSAG